MAFGLSTYWAVARAALLSVACVACVPGAVIGAPVDVSAEERAAYEKALVIPTVGRSLHNADKFLDGVKGEWISSYPARQMARVYPPGMTRDDDLWYWRTACHMSLVATATHLDATAFLTSHQNAIVTRNRFRIEQVIKAPNGIAPGAIVMVVRQGGEVVDAGERLRVAGDAGPFIPGQRYLLLAYQDEGSSPYRFVQASEPVILQGTIAYVQGRLDPESMLGSSFEVQRFAEKFQAIASNFPCDAR